LNAADKYIAEREEKRLKGLEIPKHVRYSEGKGEVQYAGTRLIEGQSLALLRHGDEVLVLPIDAATAQRIKRLAVGEPVTVIAQGSIRKSKGRSR